MGMGGLATIFPNLITKDPGALFLISGVSNADLDMQH
jgi:hypothetical protein